MNNIDIIKKINSIPENPAPLSSPQFTGIPTTPTPNGENNKQVANSEYVHTKVEESVVDLNNKLEELNNKVESFDDNIDITSLQNNIKEEALEKLDSDLVGKLSNNSVKILYSDISLQQNAIIKYVDLIIELLFRISNPDTDVKKHKEDLPSKKSILVNYYNAMYAAYGYCNKGTGLYSDFYNKFIIWYNYMNEVEIYCQQVIVDVSECMVSTKADNNFDTIFNTITGNGTMGGIYLVGEGDNRKIWVDGKYINLKGAKCTNNQGTTTIAVGIDGNIDMDVKNFKLQGRTLEAMITESVSSSEVIHEVVTTVLSSIQDKVNETIKKIDEIEQAMVTVVEDVRANIYQDILTDSQMKSIQTIYSDISSRCTAVVTEVESTARISGITDEEKRILNNYKGNITSSFGIVTNVYNQTQNEPSTSVFDNFNKAIDTHNTYIGVARAYCKTIQSNIIERLTSNKLSANKEAIVNVLNGDSKDVSMYLDGDRILLNGEHIKTNDFKSKNSINTNCVYSEYIRSNNIVNKLTNDCTVLVNKTTGNDVCDFTNNSVYSSLQNAINCMPNMIQNEVEIYLQNDITENIALRSFIGGNVKILMNGYKIYGNVLIENCSSRIEFYGINEDEHPTAKLRPCISPYDMIEYENKNFTVLAINSHNVYFRDVQLYGKLYIEDDYYDVVGKNFVLGSTKGSNVEIEYSSVAHTDNGLYADKCGKIESRDLLGYIDYSGEGTVYVNRDAYKAANGGFISIGGLTRISGFIKSTEYGGVHYLCSITEPDVEDNVTVSLTDIKSSAYSSPNSVLYYPMRSKTFYKDSLTWSNCSIYESGEEGYKCIPLWFFDNQFKDVKDKTIDKIQFIINRSIHSRTTEDFSVYLKYHNYNNTTEAQNAIQYNTVGVPLSDWKCQVNIQSDYNLLYVDIINGDVIDELVKGNIKGFALDFGDKNKYAEFNMIAVNIYYKK